MSGYPTVGLAHSSALIATTSTTVIASNVDRKYLMVINDSDTSVYLKFGTAAAVNEGFRLDPASVLEMAPVYGNLDVRQLNAIHAGTGTKKLLITEG